MDLVALLLLICVNVHTHLGDQLVDLVVRHLVVTKVAHCVVHGLQDLCHFLLADLA